MTDIDLFHLAAGDPGSLAAGIHEKKQGKKIIGTMCSYAPEELIFAAGFHPMRLFSSKSDISLAENHLQAYCCSLVRGVLEDSLSGRLGYLFGTVFPHTCDSVQRLSDIWRLKGLYPFFADVVLPAKLNTDSARTYMAAVLEKFKTDLETAAGRPIPPEDLAGAVRIYNRVRKSLARIYQLKSDSPGIISGKDLFAIVKGSMVMDRELLAGQLEAIVSDLESAAPPPSDAKRIVLSGSVCDMPGIYGLLEEMGAAVVADDLCTGRRWFDGLIPEDMDPMAGLTRRYAERLVCPAKHRGCRTRGENLAALAATHRADGVIFLLLKFCDPHAFDTPYLAEHLDQAGIKYLTIEMDDQQGALSQLSTRLETFIHMI